MQENLFASLELAQRAAKQAAAVHHAAIKQGDFAVQTKSSTSDLVTTIDRKPSKLLSM